VDNSDPKAPCSGTLNMDCSPVTGLAADPRNLDCILASTGLVHIMASGSVLRICRGKISTAYAKPYTLDPGWHFDPDHPPEADTSIPFYSIAGNTKGAWAVASDGIYHFAQDAVPDFTPFPRPYRFPASGVDWSHPDFVLVLTTMNQRLSLSGGSLILVPR